MADLTTISYLMDQTSTEVQLCFITATNIRPPRLPWLPVQVSKRSFRDTAHFLSWECPDKVRHLNMQMRALVGLTLPFYLPQRYHSMDCKAQLESSEDKHLYLTNATLFFTFSKLYGVDYWNYLGKFYMAASNEIRLSRLVSFNSFHLHQNLEHMFYKKQIHECQTAAEFLTEPWVLIQLPWHPVLYHQWLVAVLAEVLQVKKELVEFKRWPIPSRLLPLVGKLWNLVENLHCRVMLGFKLIGWQVETCPEVDSKVAKCILDKVVLPALPAIDFILSRKASEVSTALKLMAWPTEGDNDRAALMTVDPQALESFIDTIYGMGFWELQNFEMFGHTGKDYNKVVKEFVNLPDVTNFIDYRQMYENDQINDKFEEELEQLWQKDEENIKDFVVEILEKRMKGQVVDFRLQIPWEEGVNFLFFTDCYSDHKKYNDFRTGIKESEMNAMYNINCLEAEFELADVEAYVCGFALSLLKEKKNDVFLHTASGPEFSLEELEEIFKQVEAAKWTRQTLKDKFPKEVRAKVNPDERAPDLEIGHQQIMLHFEMRIKRLVYFMFEESISTGAEESFSFPEWQFVQYLLPSFVTLIGDLAKNTKVKESELNVYIQFVHHFIHGFELNLQKQPLSPQNPGQSTTNLLLTNETKFTLWQMDRLEKEIGTMVYGTFKKLDKIGSVDFALKQNCFSMLREILNKKLVVDGLEKLLLPWFDVLQTFFSRMFLSIKEVNMTQTTLVSTKNLLEASSVLGELLKVAAASSLLDSYPLELILLEAVANLRIKTMMGKQTELVKCQNKAEKKFVAELMQKLNVHQILGLLLHGCVCVLKKRRPKPEDRAKFLRPEPFNSELINSALALIAKKQWHELKLLLTPFLRDKDSNDLSLVTIEFARKLPDCYDSALNIIKSQKLKAGLSLEGWALPIKYCRSCKNCEGKLKKCSFCTDCKDFLDTNWFCNNACEEKGFDDGHREEHSVQLLKKLGLI